jgi:hypothetical protein
MNYHFDKRANRSRWQRRGDQGQQALLLVVAVALIMFSFSLVLVTQSTQELPIVNRTLIDHAAYRALQAGVNDYLYAINQNPNGVTCTSAAAPSCAYFTTQGFKFNQFTAVPNVPTGSTGISYAPSEWTSVGYPVINQANGTIQVAVVGAAGFDNATSSIEYQTANVTFKANNSFLLSVSWNQFNAIDPTLTSVGTQCIPTGYLWGPMGTTNCGIGDAGYLSQSFPYFGPVFSDDEVLVCQTPTIDHLTTAAPQLSYAVNGGCSANVTYLTPSKNLIINPYPQSPPTNINALTNPSQLQGCYYVGPTTITFTSTGGYNVSSPDTPWQASNGTTNTTYDGDSLANNKSQCLPSTTGSTSGQVSGPANGVIYVDALSSTTTCTTSNYKNLPANPLLSAYNGEPFNYDGEGSTPNCNGDAIVSGTESGGLTLAAQNDIVIDNNLTYADCPTLTTSDQTTMNGPPLGEWPTAKQCSTLAPNTVNGAANLINDTLGLIANNFVSINNPLVKNGNTVTLAQTCGTTGAPLAPACGNPYPIVMASILALGHALSVPNFQSSPGYQGTVDFYGSLGEKYIDVEETSSNNGYGVDFTWDTRLSILSPPEFFTPSTPSWITNSFSVTVGKCSEVWPIDTTSCPAIP